MGDSYFWTSRGFLEKLLQESKNNRCLSVRDSSVENASGRGDNYISKLFRVTVNQGNPAEKKTFFVKILPDEGIVRDMVERSSAFSTEMRMYRDTLPRMNKLLARCAPGQFGSLGPECYYLSSSEEPLVLVIEDLREKGYAMADRRRGLDLEHSLLVVRTLARFHACSVAARAEEPSSVETYASNLFFEEASRTFWENNFKSTLTAMAEVVRRWDGFGDEFAEKLRARSATMREDLVRLLRSRDDAFKVLLHGDLWVNNVLFRYGEGEQEEEGRRPEDAMLIDFQFCLFASPGIDLQHFVHTSPTEQVRAEHAEGLLRAYHAELSATLRLLGLGAETLSFRQLLEDYESKALYGAFAALLCLPVILSDERDAFDFESALRDEMDEAVIVRRVSGEPYSRVLRRLLVQFASKGII
ncbi:uncharacterized protein LOC134531421 [Bacillus rossius redtenbacheri]|uniref:uncharacterized protein LOC134531421 n=1 Tax=Bacillus rossius redtenbacheri TaxID=93214 RepID=UPI002FDD5EEB